MTRPPGNRTDVDAEALLAALEVHQVELESQNAELAETNAGLHRANAALEVANERYRALYDLAPAPLITIDADGTIVDLNAAAILLLGAARSDLVGGRLALYVDETARPGFRTCLQELFARGTVRGSFVVLSRHGGAQIDVLVDGVTVSSDETDRRAVLACVDITEHRRSLELQRLESLGILASGVAHDFNNLLSVVLAGADHALLTLPEDAPERGPLGEVVNAARMAGRLAHQMLAYSGRVSAPRRTIDVGAMLRDLQPLLQSSTGAIALGLEIANDLPAILGDDTQLRQIVLNLVINAADAMRKRSGAVVVAAYRETTPDRDLPGRAPGVVGATSYVVLEVRDQGVGMDPSTQARIFEPYFSTKGMGRGLGLASVQGIVRSHQGAIEVHSKVGVGTTFRVHLPAVETAAPPPMPPASAWRGAGRVLLVDDDDQVRRTMERVLESLGLTVVTAVDGVEAVDAFRQPAPGIDLVLMDLTMPRMDGVTAAIEIHAMRAEVPIILVTGYGEIPQGADHVFIGVLPKPYDIDGIRRLLARVLPAAPP